MLFRLVVVGSIVAAFLAFAATAPAAGPVTTVDRTGDSASAPDVKRITIAGDGTRFTVTVELATMRDLAPDGVLFAFIDTDQNPATGDPDVGSEFIVALDAASVAFARWDGTTFRPVVNHQTQAATSATGMRFSVTRADLGSARFDIVVGTKRGNDIDVAPDDGALSYPSRIARVIVPREVLAPRAGAVLDARFVAFELTDGQSGSSRQMTCKLTYRGRALRPAGNCSWRIPKSLKGKRLVLTFTATVASETVTRSVTVRPR